MDIHCPETVGSYLLTINAVFFILILSFKYLFLRCTDSQNFHPYDITVQQCHPQATNLNTKSHTLANWQLASYVYTQVIEGVSSVKTPAHNNEGPGKWPYFQFNLKRWAEMAT